SRPIMSASLPWRARTVCASPPALRVPQLKYRVERVAMQNTLRSLLVLTCLALATTARAGDMGFPRYDHIFLIIEENHGYNDIIGKKSAPNITRLAREYGLATQFFSTADPSAPNYVAMLGGSDFGIADDNGYYLHTVDAPSLTTQLDGAGLAWRAYLQ